MSKSDPDEERANLARYGMTPEAIDQAVDDDRAWFKSHPGRRYRIRPMIPFELGLGRVTAWVVVCQAHPVVRLRRVGGAGLPPVDTEATARYWFNRSMMGYVSH